jgi:hypothetical protein
MNVYNVGKYVGGIIMKKIYIVLLLVFALIINGCANDETLNEVYDLGKEALQITDDYINGDISGRSAVMRLSRIREDLDEIYNDYELKKKTTDNLSKSVSALSVSINVSAVKSAIELDYQGFGDDSFDWVLEKRDDLKEALEK